MPQHRKFLQEAVRLAEENVRVSQGGPYGAVIVRDNQIIAACANQVTPNLDPTAHAEVMAIRAACQYVHDFQLSDCTLYSSTEPCPMCLGAIYWSRLQAVYFATDREDAAAAGFDDRLIYNEIALPISARKIPTYHIKLAGADKPFLLWQNLHTRQAY